MDLNSQLDAPFGMRLESSDYDASDIQTKILQLKDKLDENCEDFPILLKKIHKQMQTTPELAHILQDEEISVLVQGLLRHTRTEIAVKMSPKQKKELFNKPTSLDDL